MNQIHAFRQTGEDIANQFRHNKRRRRSLDNPLYTDDIMDHEERSFFVDDDDANFAYARIRSRRAVPTFAMSKENATRYCKALVEDSTAGKTCSEVPGFNLTSALEECTIDLQVTAYL